MKKGFILIISFFILISLTGCSLLGNNNSSTKNTTTHKTESPIDINSIVNEVYSKVYDEIKEEFIYRGAYLLSESEANKLAKFILTAILHSKMGREPLLPMAERITMELNSSIIPNREKKSFLIIG